MCLTTLFDISLKHVLIFSVSYLVELRMFLSSEMFIYILHFDCLILSADARSVAEI